jgi:predicted Fe-S protein YdhL (DUF1289 family)
MADSPRVMPVESPCVGVCQLDERSVCGGCGRLIAEIAEWSRASEARRREIVNKAAVRRAERDAPKGLA